MGREVDLNSEGERGLQISSIGHDASVWFWPINEKYIPLQSLALLPTEDWTALFPQEVLDSLPQTFVWSHPVAIDFANLDKDSDPNFMLCGGLVLYDESGHVCAVCKIGEPADVSELHCSMHFGQPIPWKSRWTMVLRERFQRITMSELRGKGTCYYCWVCANEPALRFLDPPELPNGGFAFLFHDDFGNVRQDSLWQDVVFPLEW